MITENLSILKIHNLTQEQYNHEYLNGTLDRNALYLTPDEENELTKENIVDALGYTPIDASGGTAGQFAISDGEGGIKWQDPVDQPIQEVNANFYMNLSNAISDINNNTKDYTVSSDNASVKVIKEDNGKAIVTLLTNVSETAVIEIKKDINLILNGHKIIFTKWNAYLNFTNGISSIDGKIDGSGIENIGNTGTINGAVRLIRATSDLYINGGNYILNIDANQQTSLITVSGTCNLLQVENCNLELFNINGFTTTKDSSLVATLAKKSIFNNVKMFGKSKTDIYGIINMGSVCEVQNCDITVVLLPYNGSAIAYGAYSNGELRVTDTIIHADAPGCDATTEYSTGIKLNLGAVAYIENSEVYATHTGISITDTTLYVRGGILCGMSHGGFYITHTAEDIKPIYFKDVKLLHKQYMSDHYEGEYDATNVEANGGIGSNCYIGYSHYELGYTTNYRGTDVYVDGCTFNGGFCVRDDMTRANQLFISNTEVKNDEYKFRVRKSNTTHGSLAGQLKIGTGCNITPNDIYIKEEDNEGSIDTCEITNELYRKFYFNEELTAEDYNFGGKLGQFAVSDGRGGIKWVSLTNVGEVGA